MATNGNESKKMIFTKLQEIFPDSFVYGKELRINLMENGEKIQIKVVLTKSKTIVDAGADTAATAPINASQPSVGGPSDPSTTAEIPWETPADSYKPTPKEKEDISILLQSLGF